MTHKIRYFNLLLAVFSILFLLSCKKTSNPATPDPTVPDPVTPGPTTPGTPSPGSTPTGSTGAANLYILGATKDAASGLYTGHYLSTPTGITSYTPISGGASSEILYGSVATNGDVYLGNYYGYYKNGTFIDPFTSADKITFHNILPPTFTIYNDRPVFGIRTIKSGTATQYDYSIIDAGKRILVISDDATNKYGILRLIKTGADEYYALTNHLIGSSQSNAFVLKVTGGIATPLKIDLGSISGKVIAAVDISVANGKIYVIANIKDLATTNYSLSLITINTDGSGLSSKAIGTSGSYFTVANSITVSGSQIYVCGGEQLSSSSKVQACYWDESNAQVKLPVSATADASISKQVFKNGTDVYAVGEEQYPKERHIVIWKNGVKIVDGLKTTSSAYIDVLHAYIK